MKLSPKQCRAVLEGRKRQHRVPLSAYSKRMEVGEQMTLRKPVSGILYGREQQWTEAVCRIEIVDSGIEIIAELPLEGIKAEGFKSRDAFMTAWRAQHPSAEECWCMTWRIVEDIYIPSVEGHGDEHNYTRHHGSALEQELGEGVNPDEIPEYEASRHAAERRQREQGEAQATWLALSPEEKLRRLRLQADATGVDLSRQMASIERRIESARAKVVRLSASPSEKAA